MRSILVATLLLLPGCIDPTTGDEPVWPLCFTTMWNLQGTAPGAWATIRATSENHTKWRYIAPAGLPMESWPDRGPGRMAVASVAWHTREDESSPVGDSANEGNDTLVKNVVLRARMAASTATLVASYLSRSTPEEIEADARYFIGQIVPDPQREEVLDRFLASRHIEYVGGTRDGVTGEYIPWGNGTQEFETTMPRDHLQLPHDLEFGTTGWEPAWLGGGSWIASQWRAFVVPEQVKAVNVTDAARITVAVGPNDHIDATQTAANLTHAAATAAIDDWLLGLGIPSVTWEAPLGPYRGEVC